MTDFTFTSHDTNPKNQTGREFQESRVFPEEGPPPDPATSCNEPQGIRALDAPLPLIIPPPWLHVPNKKRLTQADWLKIFSQCLDWIYYLESLLPDHLRQDASVPDDSGDPEQATD